MLSVKRVHDGYIVINDHDEGHSHFRRRSSANLLIKLIERNKLPRNNYLQVAARRVLTEDEFNQLRGKDKQTYINRKAL